MCCLNQHTSTAILVVSEKYYCTYDVTISMYQMYKIDVDPLRDLYLIVFQVGYEVGANNERLPDTYMNDLDNELIPVIHSAASQNHGGAISLELVFHVLD